MDQEPQNLFILFLILLSSAGFSASQPGTPDHGSSSDRFALLSFKSSIFDSAGALASWENTSLDFCQWRGVACTDIGGEPRVTSLQLQSLNLSGEISPSLANLTFLQTLGLSDNNLHGPIPQELGHLSQLQFLNLSYNPLGGMIPRSLFHNCSKLAIVSLTANKLIGTIPPTLGNCLELQVIGLDYNELEGEIPGELGSLRKLQTLVLDNNNLTRSIPPEIGNLSSLTGLFLSANHLSGSIPASIGNLSSLENLHLQFNNLSGAIPSAIGNLHSVTLLFLHVNNLSGAIPPEIGNLVKLFGLVLASNQLVGTVPQSLGYLKNLDTLILNGNKLEAGNAADWSFMSALSNCTHLRRLDLGGNNLGGTLPQSITNLSKSLESLILADNQIAGSIPAEIGNFLNLTTINMSSNHLSGTLPATLGRLRRLGLLDMSNNHFFGQIPVTLGNLTGLSYLILSSNELNGSVPSNLGNCPLIAIKLDSNKLTGTVPKEILFISSLSTIINVSHNSLNGSLPSEFGNLINTETIDVSNNEFSGEIPSSIARCELLQYLYLQGNYFEGSIPSSFSQLKMLQVLDVSNNNLSGHIPDFLRSFRIESYLNLSYNNFNGEVPIDGPFKNASSFSIAGNRNLCGGVPELSLPSCSSRKKVSVKLIAIISTVGGVLCLIIFFSLFAFHYRKKKASRLLALTSSIKEQYMKVSFAQLLKATNGFAPANLIGMGSFGSVYKGTMDWEDNKDVAVKVLNLQRKGALRTFTAECEALRNIRHRNLVKILTSCSSVDFQGNDFKALVFEFLRNGSLDQWLHPDADEEGTLQILSLSQRLNISIDVASALSYLHHHGPAPLVHCDLKPSNVLLDQDMVAHVADFGLAKFITKTARSTNSITFKGSIGYVAPEYGMNNKASTEGDVYSFGILVLELFTGKRPTDDSFNEDLNLHKFVEMALPKGVFEVVDPKLLLEVEEGELAGLADLSTSESRMRAMECITSMLRVGILCSKQSPKERMRMSDATRELQDIRDAFLGLISPGQV